MEEFLFACFLLFMSALFSSSETALFLISSKKNFKKRKIVDKLLNKPILLLNTILLGNIMVNILFSNISEDYFSHKVFNSIPYPELKIFIVIICSTFLVLIFGEVLPKNIGLNYPSQVANLTSYPLYFIKKLLFPLSFLLSKIANFFINLGKHDHELNLTKSELKHILALSHRRGILKKEESELIQKIIHFSHTDIAHLMIPRKELIAISQKETLAEAWEKMKELNPSKLMIYKENIDNIIGYLHIRDMINESDYDKPISQYQELLREAQFVPETKNPVQVLRILRARKASFAVVLDEYGGTAGIITVNQIIKSIIGECYESSFKKVKIKSELSDREIIVNANYITLREIKEYFNIEEEWQKEEETLASYVLEKLDRIPKKGDMFSAYELEWQILEMKGNSIASVRVIKEKK